MYRFADPLYLLLLLVLPLLVFWYFKQMRRGSGKIRYSDISLIKNLGNTAKQRLRHILFLFRLLGLALIIGALARPQSSSKETETSTEGLDIVLAMDVSSSMLAEDFKPNNRLKAAKLVAQDFIKGRSNDRIGLVVYAGESFIQCPLTLDYGVLLTLLEKQSIADQDWDGTAIGLGIANAVNRLRESKAKSKVIILLTDGVNNAGSIDPITAAQIAAAYEIKIYTIGVGTRGTAMYPVEDPILGKHYVPMQVQIDEQTLRQIANITGGKYFRATNTTKLKNIYTEISKMEKTKIEVKEYTRYEEYFVYLLAAGLLLLLIELVLANTYFKKLP